MPNPYHPLYSSIVCILDERNAIVGAGFLAIPNLVCTCAHVVADALNIPRESKLIPEGVVRLVFPFLDEAGGEACIEAWVPMEPHEGGGDIAVLRLTSGPPSASRPVRLLPVSNLSGRNFEVFGFPSTTNVGQYAYGILRDRLPNDYVQLEGTSTQGYRVQRGYSGSPVWDHRGRGVVGMIVAEDRGTPEAKVAFLIPNDLIQHVYPDIKPISLHQLYTPLTDGLVGLPGSPLNGVEHFLREYLGTPDAPAPFGGRQVQLDALDRWLANPAQPYALIVAEAGRGKSALLTQWVTAVADEHRAEVIFIPISIRFSTSLKSTTLSLLGARLRHLHHIKADFPRDAEGWLAEIEIYLREDRPDGAPMLIVLDGADEAADWMLGRDLHFPPQFGHGIKVLVSARSLADCDAAGWMRRLAWQGVGVPIELPLLARSGVVEVLRSMGDPLARLVTQVDIVGELYRLSEGDPLLVRLYVEALRGTGEHASFLTAEDLGQLKPGLEAYFDRWWDDQRRQWGSAAPLKEPTVRTLLNILACALGPLSSDDLLTLMQPEQCDLWILEETLQPLARFVIGDGKEHGYVFSHPRLNLYFYEKLPMREREVWEQRFLNYGRQTLLALLRSESDPHDISPYLVRYYGAHLERMDADPDLFDELIFEGWQRAWEGLEGTYDGFLSDLARAWKRVETVGTQAQSIQERTKAIRQQCRYALIVASINSLAGNIPPTLVTALVDKRIWVPIQGLAFARQILSETKRVEALTGLAPYLSEPLLHEALAVIHAIEDESNQAEALAGLVSRLTTLGNTEEALAVARSIKDESIQAEALTDLVSRLAALGNTEEALVVAHSIKDKYIQAEALADLVSHLVDLGNTKEALAVAHAIESQYSQARALAGLVSRLAALGNTKEALTIARAIENNLVGHGPLPTWLHIYLSRCYTKRSQLHMRLRVSIAKHGLLQVWCHV